MRKSRLFAIATLGLGLIMGSSAQGQLTETVLEDLSQPVSYSIVDESPLSSEPAAVVAQPVSSSAATQGAKSALSCGCQDHGKGGKGGCEAAALKKAAGSHKGLFFLNDYSYLCDPCYDSHLLGDNLKRLTVGDCGLLDIGGQIRLRYHNEHGMKGTRFQLNTDDFTLTRVRLFANYEANDNVRIFMEGLYADSSGHAFAPRGIDENCMDFQNAFIDVRLTDAATVRAGRQELLYGAQRTVSPLDWANTRRKFEGLNLLYRSGDWKIDAFYTHFVPVQVTNLDEADYDRPFYGAYTTYSGFCDETWDFYYLGSENNTTGQELHTLGTRVFRTMDQWLFEFEGAAQFGRRSVGVDQEEGFATIGLGHKWDCAWSPTLWFYYDYASENYNQLYPLAHKYLGFIDAVQRQNIESPNVLLQLKPRDKLSLLLWYYHFQSNSAAPVPAIGGTPPQNAGQFFGNELDILTKYQLSPRSDVVLGWSHLWSGSKILNPGDADFFYAQWHLNF